MKARRTYRLAWLLMAAYLPMMVAGVFHTHSAPPSAALCDDCLRHIDHPTHLAPPSDGGIDCAVCHLLSTPRLAAAAVALPVALPMVRRMGAARADSPTHGACCRPVPRAPPASVA